MKIRWLCLGALVVAGCACPQAEEGADESGFVPIFNGRDLPGWEGATNTYCVSREGFLTCMQSDGDGASGAKNLSTDGTVPADGIRRPGLHNASGRIHWCGHGHNIFWRNIRIRELP